MSTATLWKGLPTGIGAKGGLNVLRPPLREAQTKQDLQRRHPFSYLSTSTVVSSGQTFLSPKCPANLP